LERAFDFRQYQIAKLFIEHGAQINNKDNPAIVNAAHGDRSLHLRGTTFLDLVKDIEGYPSTGFIVWIKDMKCLGSLDVEHDNLFVLQGVKWKQFVRNVSSIVDDILS
jgi:hypothetical protein